MAPTSTARRRTIVWLTTLVLAAVSIQTPMAATAEEPVDRAPTQASDFDGDGFADVVIGGRGAIFVVYGAETGLRPERHQRWILEDLPGGYVVTDQSTGSTGTAGDFNGDSFSDLAIHAEGVHVLYGSSIGLTLNGSAYFPIAIGSADVAMASGNFGRSHHADLAIGVAIEETGTLSETGAVTVLYGTTTGLSMRGHQQWSQDSRGIRGSGEGGDGFGDELVAADFGRSGYDDLAISVPFESPLGAVNVIYGSAAGLTAAGNQLWTPRSEGLRHNPSDLAATEPWFMMSLAAGHFAGGRQADLAIGAPYRSTDSDEPIGTVNVIYGSASGLTPEGNQLWTERTRGVLGKAGSDGFGEQLTVGNFGRDVGGHKFDDLAIGAPANGPSNDYRGAVHVLYGSAAGLSVVGNQLWKQNVPGVPGASEEGDNFGSTVTDGDFGRSLDNRAYDDLVIGSPGEDLTGDSEPDGRALVIYGADRGLSTDSMQVLSLGSLRAPPERADFQFGLSLTASSTADEHG